jgi:hypothetical protein
MIDELLETNGTIFETILPDNSGISFKYRLLTLKEYNLFSKIRRLEAIEENSLATKVFERCYLGDSAFLPDDLPAGILISIGKLILWMSGDCDNYTLDEDLARHRSNNPDNTIFSYIRSVIVTVFPMYTLEIMNSWDREEILRKFVIAENILSKQRENYKKLELTREDPKKPKKTKHGIDFARENAMLRSKQNPFDIEQAQDKVSESDRKLSKEQLKSLEARRR